MDNQAKIRNELKNRPEVFDNHKSIAGFLKDCFPGENDKANQLHSALEKGVIKKLLESKPRDEFFRERLIGDYKGSGYEQAVVEWIVTTWLYLIDEEVIRAWQDYLLEKENAKKRKEESPSQIVVEDEENIDSPIASLSEVPEGIFIPCGVGNDDKGFSIQGIREAAECHNKNESYFAVVFNYLQRTLIIDEKRDKPTYIKNYERKLPFEIDYRNIYRLMLIILALVKNNYINDDVVSFGYDGDYQEIKIAFSCINNYLKLLCRLAGNSETVKLKYQENRERSISFKSNKSSVKIVEYKGSRETKRTVWSAKRIQYCLKESSKEDLEYLLEEISPYKSFYPGQFDAIRLMLCPRSHSICIMPTGSGKSLVFYLCSILQPGVTFVISPTELLIEDQIENLKKYHRMDDVKHLKYASEDIKDFVPDYKICYLTPETFQNTDLLKKFIDLNSNKKIANLVLDEVHCISNWSHDFRAEYLMLSTYLNNYLDRTYYMCFTATANYSVIKDIKKQLGDIDDEYIISPLKLERNNIKFQFVSCGTTGEMYKITIEFLRKNLTKGQKTLIFTKNDIVSTRLHEALEDLKYEAAVYKTNNKNAYRAFADGQCRVLIANDDLGIGINLSDVHNVLHFGLPISKGEFVQQVGRAGRHGETATSLVVYLRCNSANVDERLLHRNTETSEIIEIVRNERNKNDYLDTYQKLIGNISSQNEFFDLLYKTYSNVKPVIGSQTIDFPLENSNKTKKCLYILFAIGYLDSWSSYNVDADKGTMTVSAYKEREQSLEHIKESTIEYLYILGGNKKSISLVGDADSVEDILRIYIEWYYNHFIYHHKEQFLDMLSFFESYKTQEKEKNTSNDINKRLASYFSLSMLEISQDAEKYINLSFVNISETILGGVDYNTVSNIQRINQDANNVKLDYFLFLYTLICDNEYDRLRMERIIAFIDNNDYYDFLESISMVYENLLIENRVLLFKHLYNYAADRDQDFGKCIDMIYRHNSKDVLFYGIMAKELNTVFGG